MRILFSVAPGYGLMLPVVPLMWAARVAGHEVLVASTSEMIDVGSRAGLPMADVFPDRDLWGELMKLAAAPDGAMPEMPWMPEWMTNAYRSASQSGGPFGLFTLTMTEGTISAGRDFGADLVVHTTDHAAGRFAAAALGKPVLEVGNRVSWSSRDSGAHQARVHTANEDITRAVREHLGVPDVEPELIARVDPRAPSMGGLLDDEVDHSDGAPWWPMRFVPFNGGSEVPGWALRHPDRPRVGVTLGTVVPQLSGTSSLAVVLEALGALDLEVVLAAGAAALDDLGTMPDNVRSVGYLPLSTFLPTTSLLVHHGGSGTTAAPLHYGVPQLVLPAFADNPMSAERVVDRGVGLSHDPRTVDADSLRGMVRRLLDEPSFTANAQAVAAEMAAQPTPFDVLQRAVSYVHPH